MIPMVVVHVELLGLPLQVVGQHRVDKTVEDEKDEEDVAKVAEILEAELHILFSPGLPSDSALQQQIVP
eukprot:SAG31_NODE_7_length_42755_cov_130.245728_30_plen_69_part_00